jgi:hypothetical protein
MTQEKKDLLKPIFWDTNINDLDFKSHKRYGIERILQYGYTDHIRWMLGKFDTDEIIETVKKSKIIDRKTANYWSIHFGINKDEILCFTKPQSAMSNSMF